MIPLKRENRLLLDVAELLNKLLNWLDWPLSPDFQTGGQPYALFKRLEITKQCMPDSFGIKITE